MGWGLCPALDAVSILVGFGGDVVSLGPPPSPKHRSLSNLAPSETGIGHASGVSPWFSHEHLCLCPLH